MVTGSGVQAQGLGFVQVVKDVATPDGLDGARSVTVSPDDQHVYTTSLNDHAVAVFSRNATTGQLTYVEAHFDDVGVVDGLWGAISVTVSPDGKHVYAAGLHDDAVVVFSRNATTGKLTYVEAHFDNVGGVYGLDGPTSVTVSPDGKHVYASSRFDDAVALFSRNATTGRLTFIVAHFDDAGATDGLDGAYSVAVSPDGGDVYVASESDHAVAVFSRNPTTGVLTFIEAHFDGVDGVDGISLARAMTVSPDGANVYVAGLSDNAVAVFSRNTTTGKLTFVEAHVDGIGGADGLNGAYAVTVSPDGGHVYAAGSGEDAVAVFSRDATTGALTFVEVERDGVGGVDGLDDPRSVALSGDGAHVYVTGRADNAVAVFSRNASTGALTFFEALFDGIASVDGLDGAYSVAVSPDGQHVYTAGWVDDAVAVFSRNATTGALTYVEAHLDGAGGVDGLDGARSVAVSPDGQHVYAAGLQDDAVVVFSRNATTGKLTFVERKKDGFGSVDGLDGAISVTVSPDGDHLYAAGSTDDAVAVFSRNATTGALTYVEVHKDGMGVVDGLDAAFSVTVSPDGRHVYGAGFLDDAVAVFSRDASTGALTFVEFEQDGMGGVDGLDGARSVAVSPDGAHVYVAGALDDAVAVFSRKATTGKLRFVEAQQDGMGGVNGLDEAISVTVSPSGQHVYAASFIDDAVVVFSRNATTGALRFVEVQQDGVGSVDGLDGATSVTVSPDGDHVYAAGQNDDAVAVFVRLGPGIVVRYVATTGSDTNNDCTVAATPCLTLAHAVGQANAGDTLDLAAGTYPEPGLMIDKALAIQGQGVVVQ